MLLLKLIVLTISALCTQSLCAIGEGKKTVSLFPKGFKFDQTLLENNNYVLAAKKLNTIIMDSKKGTLSLVGEIVRFLLSLTAGQSYRILNSYSYGRTPLHMAVIKDQPEIVSLLLLFGTNPNHIFDIKYTPFKWTIMYLPQKNKIRDMVDIILDRNILIKPNIMDLLKDSAGCSFDIQKYIHQVLVKQYKCASAFLGLMLKNIRFSSFGDRVFSVIDKVKYFVEAGADIETRNEEEQTMLMRAAQLGDLEVVKYLVEKGADINLKNIRGENALDLAEYSGKKHVVIFLNKIAKNKED